jgi:NodT family efflux transporter outer membrane factor (OMF) lipoprotein
MNAVRLTMWRLRRNATAGLALMIALVSGCMTGPEYKKPDVPVPEKWSGPLENGEKAGRAWTVPWRAVGAPQLALWWKVFGDPVLDSLMTRAVESNLDLRTAEARVHEARAALRMTEADLAPQLNAAGSYTRNRIQAQTPTGEVAALETDLYQAGFDASWELDIFGGTRREAEAARADAAGAEEARQDVLVTLVAEVARNYIELRGVQNRLDIARKNIGIQQDSLAITRSRFQAGLTSELDVKQAEAQLATLQASVPTLETAIKRSIHRLGGLLGRPPGTLEDKGLQPLVDDVSTTASLPSPPLEVAVGLPSDLLRRRPDVRQAERKLAAATARIGVATASLFPRFSLTGSFGGQSDTIEGLKLGANHIWSIGPSVIWPVFDGGRIRANIRVQNARQEQALAAYEKAVMTSLEDVENALVAYAKEQNRFVCLSDAVEANRRALDIANDLYSRGLVNFLNVLDAERSLFAAEDQQTQSKAAVLTNLVALYKSLGGGWDYEKTLVTSDVAQQTPAPGAQDTQVK